MEQKLSINKLSMKNIVAIVIAFVAIFCVVDTANAQQRTKVGEGVYITTYGNVAVVENDNTQQSIEIKVTKSDGLYEILCGDTIVKRVAKEGIKTAINSAIEYADKYIKINSWISKTAVSYYVDKYYESVCNYFGS